MSQQKLDLFDFSSIYVAKFRTGSPEITRSEMIQLHPFGTPPNHVPDDVLGDSLSTWRSVTTNGAKRSGLR
jgi:hypothetical protein